MDKLIEENMGLVISIVNSFKPRNETEREDLLDAGRIGLWNALKKHNIDKGQISTYAWRPIRWAIIKEIKSRRESISLENIKEPTVSSKESLWECISSDVTEEEKRLVELRIEGYSFKEICQILNQKPSVVKNKFYKIINRLREVNA